MSMPQVHLIAYCGDLGMAAARGAECCRSCAPAGWSAAGSGFIADASAGSAPLVLGSTLQCAAAGVLLPFNGLTSSIVSALFGLSQGGIVPSYALIVRDIFRRAGRRPGQPGVDDLGRSAWRRRWIRQMLRLTVLPGRLPQRRRLEPAHMAIAFWLCSAGCAAAQPA